jgi:hypothetical protein
LAFDLLNFNPLDASDAVVYLDGITVNRFPLDSLSTHTVINDYTFEFDTNGWTTAGAPAVFTPPDSGHENGALYLKSSNNIDTFGYWQSNASDIIVVLNRIYRGTFAVRTDVTEQSRVPQMRLRFNAENLQASRVLGIESIGNGVSSPGTERTVFDSLFFLPPASCAGEGIFVSFDLLNFTPDDAAGGKLILEDAMVETLPVPNLP